MVYMAFEFIPSIMVYMAFEMRERRVVWQHIWIEILCY
jgi:hypothetical protein